MTKEQAIGINSMCSILKASNDLKNFIKIKRALLYRLFNPKTGEHSKQYGIELQFSNKEDAEQYLKFGNIKYQEIDDVQDFPL